MSSGACSRAMKGWLAGCGAATAFISVFVLVGLAITSNGNLPRLVEGIVIPALLIFVVTCLLTGLPAILVIWLSEKFGIRSILFFGSAGAVTGALSGGYLVGAFGRWPSIWFFGLAGFVAGMVYWRIAGRYAGGDREASRNSA